MFRVNKPPPDARILKLRDYEERLARLQQAIKEDSKSATAATWEVKTDERIKKTQVHLRLEALQARNNADLERRRDRLAALLYHEEQSMKEELIRTQETPQQRRAKLADRARALVAAREAEREQLAQQLKEQAFRANCDPLRERHSRILLYRTAEERQKQIEEKMSRRIAEEEEKKYFAMLAEEEGKKKELRYQMEKQQQAHHREELKRLLDEQMMVVQERHNRDAEQQARELEQLQRIWATLEEEERQAEAAEKERLHKLAEEVKEYALMQQKHLNEVEQAERALDLKILQEALAKEAADEAQEQQIRNKKREEMQQYRAQLALMMQREADDEAEKEAAIREYNAQREAKEDAEWAAREAARKRLMEEVDRIRQEQIRWRLERRLEEIEEGHQEREWLEADVKAAQEVKERSAHEARRRALRQQLDVETQVVARAHIRRAEEEEQKYMTQLSAEREAAYMDRVQKAMGTTEAPTYFGRKKVDWFY